MNRAGGVPDVQKALDDLSNALEEYWGKWELVNKENAESLMRVDLALQQKGSPSSGADSNITGSDTGASNDSFIPFNPPIDAKPAFLERESSMLEVLNFIESVENITNHFHSRSLFIVVSYLK